MKRQLADRARQAEALEKQQQLEQQKLELIRSHGNDLADVVSNAKEFQIERKSRTIQFPSSTEPVTSATGVCGSVGDHAPSTPKTGSGADLSHTVDATATSITSSATSSSSSATLINIERDTPSSLQDAVVVKQNHPLSPSVRVESRKRTYNCNDLQKFQNYHIPHGIAH